jgi:signal transduction histidine kinase
MLFFFRIKGRSKLSNDEKLIVTIIDNGLGIPEDLQDKVFDMFFHGAAKSGGTGLGLYMARKAIERLGGNIQLISGQPRNTIFEIILPHFSDSFKKPERVTVKKITSKV